LICDGRGIPLAIQLTAANRNDCQQALALVDAISPLQGGQGRQRHRPDCVVGDRGYDAQMDSFAWLNQFRRLRVRYEKRSDIHEAFLALGCILICWRFLIS
jgi:transposase